MIKVGLFLLALIAIINKKEALYSLQYIGLESLFTLYYKSSYSFNRVILNLYLDIKSLLANINRISLNFTSISLKANL